MRCGFFPRQGMFLVKLLAMFLIVARCEFVAAAEEAPEFLWAKQQGGSGDNEGYGLAVDKAGNVYVTGIMGLKQHHSIGTHGWSHSGGEIFLAKYDARGKLLWLQKAGGNGTDAGIAVAVDEAENAYITGYFSGTVKFGSTRLKAKEGGQSRGRAPADIFVAKYDSTGKPLWVRQAGGEGLDQGYGIATDKHGNVYVTGYFQGRATFGGTELTGRTQPDPRRDYDSDYGDMFVAKYDGAGNLAWVKQSGEQHKNYGLGLAVGDLGNVYVLGRFEGGSIRFGEIRVADTKLCHFISKYAPDGEVLWAQATAGSTLHGGRSSIATYHTGQVIVAGNFEVSQSVAGVSLQADAGLNEEIFMLKYDADGKLLWGRQAGGKAHELCNGVAVDEAGNAYITGSFDDVADFGSIHVKAGPHNPGISGTSVYVAKYGPSGEPLWVKTAEPKPTDEANGYFAPDAITVDRKGNVFISGKFFYSVTFGGATLTHARDFFGDSGAGAYLVKLGTNSPATH